MIDRTDIEAKVREIEDAVSDTAASFRNQAMLGVLVVVGVVAFAYVLGKRRNRAPEALVEVYRL